MLLVPSAAIACQCGTLDLSDRIAEADLVLVGKVSSFKPLDQVTVSPIEVFKGYASKALTIQTSPQDARTSLDSPHVDYDVADAIDHRVLSRR